MKKMLAIAAGLGMTGSLAHAQGYVVNGRAASPAEVQHLVSYGAQPGHWLVDGYGIASADRGRATPATAPTRGSDQKCWYVLDVQLCE